MWGVRFKVLGSGFRVNGLVFRIWVSGFGVYWDCCLVFSA